MAGSEGGRRPRATPRPGWLDAVLEFASRTTGDNGRTVRVALLLILSPVPLIPLLMIDSLRLVPIGGLGMLAGGYAWRWRRTGAGDTRGAAQLDPRREVVLWLHEPAAPAAPEGTRDGVDRPGTRAP